MSHINKRQKLHKTPCAFQTSIDPLSSKESLGGPTTLSQKPKCSFILTSFTKCGETRIPLSKFCIKHIMNDTTQVETMAFTRLRTTRSIHYIFVIDKLHRRCYFGPVGPKLSLKMSRQKMSFVKLP
jgi:hypothetical protein